MSHRNDAVHGQWRMMKHEVDNGSIYLTEMLVPVLYSKEYLRGWYLLDGIRREYKRKLH